MKSTTDMSRQELEAYVAQLKADKEKAAAARPVTFKVGAKGGVSAYGLGRWPVTLYKSQWARLIERIPELKQYLKDHDSELAEKA